MNNQYIHCAVEGSINLIEFVTLYTIHKGLIPPSCWLIFLDKHTTLSFMTGTISTLKQTKR